MKKLLLLSMVLFALNAAGQETQKFYSVEKDAVISSEFKQVKETVKLNYTDEKNSIAGVSSIILGTVAGELVPRLVKQIGTWVYNPENYISEHGAAYHFEKNKIMDLSSVKNFAVLQTGTKEINSEEIISKFIFSITNINEGDKTLTGYKVIALSAYELNFTQARLKNNGKDIHVVLEPIITYYDKQHQKKELILKSIRLSKIVPGKSVEVLEEKELNYQIIPPHLFIESIAVRITEVNNRKKDWDAFLTLYNTQEGKISEFIIGKLTQ
ncbi:hypothetical protein [Maribacter sp. 2210JD10-5]|uniref:hypothetical protein n=1 Tax=Maribacter sp. 2210JD10-5 TaxID=3386272 RepID=UPI0039BC977C